MIHHIQQLLNPVRPAAGEPVSDHPATRPGQSPLRRTPRLYPKVAAEQIPAVCTGHDYSKPGKPKIDWDDPQAKDALVSALVNDANALVAVLPGTAMSARSRPGSRWRCWRWSPGRTSSRPAGSDGPWRIARKVAEDRIRSIVDTGARHTRKSPEARRDSYRAYVAADAETGIITGSRAAARASRQCRPDGSVITPQALSWEWPNSAGS